jgi:hypothetical protein
MTGGKERQVTATDPRSRPEVQAVASALQPYRWRGFRPQLLARTVVAANDRQHLRGLLAGFPGVTVGAWDPLEPVDRDDVRLPGLIEFLSTHRWTELGPPPAVAGPLACCGPGAFLPEGYRRSRRSSRRSSLLSLRRSTPCATTATVATVAAVRATGAGPITAARRILLAANGMSVPFLVGLDRGQ